MVCAYAPNSSSEYPPFLKSLEKVLDSVSSRASIILLGDFSAHVGNDNMTRWGLIGRNDLPNLIPSVFSVIGFGFHSFSITNTIFSHKSDHKHWTLELSTDHHLVMSWIRWQGRKSDRPSRSKEIVRVC